MANADSVEKANGGRARGKRQRPGLDMQGSAHAGADGACGNPSRVLERAASVRRRRALYHPAPLHRADHPLRADGRAARHGLYPQRLQGYRLPGARPGHHHDGQGRAGIRQRLLPQRRAARRRAQNGQRPERHDFRSGSGDRRDAHDLQKGPDARGMGKALRRPVERPPHRRAGHGRGIQAHQHLERRRAVHRADGSHGGGSGQDLRRAALQAAGGKAGVQLQRAERH